jgi:hypothetical protein
MTQEMIAELARKIAEGQAYADWKFYVSLLCLVALGSFIGAWLTGFATERGKFKAIDTNISLVLKQLALTTETTAQIQLSLAHSDWVSKEYKTARRQNLEKLLYALYETRDWVRTHMASPPSARAMDFTQSPINKVVVTSTLYFPELGQFEKDFSKAHSEFLKKHTELFEPIRTATFRLDQLNGLIQSFQAGTLQLDLTNTQDIIEKIGVLERERANALQLYRPPVTECYKALQYTLLAFEREIAATMSTTISS